MHILIADDSPSIRLTLSRMMTAWGYQVQPVASGGLDALEALSQADGPKIAILDWMMPDMDGPEVCRRVRQIPMAIHPYLILLTVKDSKEDVVQGLEMGANDFLSKPFHEGELRARIQVGQRVIELETALLERIKALEEAATHIKTLQGILPICMYCHKIRDDQESWRILEEYLSSHTDAQLSHGVCPDCRHKFFQ